MPDHRLVALIPARAGSKRLAGKNTRDLAGHPLLAYAIAAAQESELFSRIVVSTDSWETVQIAREYGADFVMRPRSMATDWSPDIEWVNHAMTRLDSGGRLEAAFAIIRPTSPFRRGAWIRAAWDKLRREPRADSIRAVTPDGALGKKWVCSGEFLIPIAPFTTDDVPWHSLPSQETPQAVRQTAALEIAWANVLPESISGRVILRYLTEPDAPMSHDINTPEDWLAAERLAAAHPEALPVPTVVGLRGGQ